MHISEEREYHPKTLSRSENARVELLHALSFLEENFSAHRSDFYFKTEPPARTTDQFTQTVGNYLANGRAWLKEFDPERLPPSFLY